MALQLSPAARVSLRPFRGYHELAGKVEADLRQALAAAGEWLLIIACLVAFTTTGRLTLDHVLFSPLAWSFLPLLQCGWLLLCRRLLKIDVAAAKLVVLFYAGHLPGLLLFALLTGICLFAPEAWPPIRWLLQSRVFFLAILLALGWSTLLTFALFRSGCALSRKRTLAATGLYYAGHLGCLIGYFAVTGQLAPLLGLLD